VVVTRISTGFTGFEPGCARFLSELAANNERAWFVEHKPIYEAKVRGPLASLVGSVSLALAAHDLPLQGDPKSSIFRVNRDVRFSKDKRPYKTAASAVWTRDGTKKSQGLLYFQIDAAGAFVAAGFYGPDPEQLHALRTEIADKPRAFLDIEAQLERAGLALSTEHALTRLPRGFDVETAGEVAHAIRCTSFVVSRPISLSDAAKPELVDALAGHAAAVMPLLRFGWTALSGLPPRRP
jgi:uncharacterized protein (TIGR02453 family)